jgi:hypothetical protein
MDAAIVETHMSSQWIATSHLGGLWNVGENLTNENFQEFALGVCEKVGKGSFCRFCKFFVNIFN